MDDFSNIEEKNLQWLKKILFLVIFILFSWIGQMWYITTYEAVSLPLYAFQWVIIFIIISWVIYFTLFNRKDFMLAQAKENPIEETTEDLLLSKKTNKYYLELLRLMEEDKIYQNSLLNLDILSEKTQLSNGYISRIIKEKENKNFYDFVNTFRVKEVKNNLQNSAYAHYSILGIGLEAGFKSKSTFYAVFKKMTGMTPSDYKKSLDN